MHPLALAPGELAIAGAAVAGAIEALGMAAGTVEPGVDTVDSLGVHGAAAAHDEGVVDPRWRRLGFGLALGGVQAIAPVIVQAVSVAVGRGVSAGVSP